MFESESKHLVPVVLVNVLVLFELVVTVLVLLDAGSVVNLLVVDAVIVVNLLVVDAVIVVNLLVVDAVIVLKLLVGAVLVVNELVFVDVVLVVTVLVFKAVELPNIVVELLLISNVSHFEPCSNKNVEIYKVFMVANCTCKIFNTCTDRKRTNLCACSSIQTKRIAQTGIFRKISS
jgi:hypothetical protein